MSDTPLTDEQAGYPDGSGCWKYTELEAKMEDGYSPRLPNPHDD